MSLSDPIGDMLARLKNSQMRSHKKVQLPSSKFKTKIAEILNIEGSSAYVRVSELKKQAVDKLINSVDHSQVLDYL